MEAQGRGLAQLVEQRPVCRGFVLTAADPGSTPGLGPFAACHSLVSRPVSCHLFSLTTNKAIKKDGKWNDADQDLTKACE